jgi:Glycosyl transferase family 2
MNVAPAVPADISGVSTGNNAATDVATESVAAVGPIPTLELTILMPCLNEAETLRVCIEKGLRFLSQADISGEVLIADNGSTDGSQAIARSTGARVVDVPEKGYGAALIHGIESARGRYIIMGDSDDSYNFTRLEAFVSKLRNGDELVMGNRFQGGIAAGAMPPLHRWLGNPVLSFLGRLIYGIPVGDFHCGLRGFSRAAMRRLGLKSAGMEFASEMIVKAAFHGLKISEVPTTLSPDGRSRPPHLRTWRDGWRHLRFLLLHSPKWLFMIPGAALIGLGTVVAALLAPGAVQITPTLQINEHSLVVACFSVIIGCQLLVFGALARRYSATEGFIPASQAMRGALAGLTLERLLQVSVLMILAGGAGVFWSFFNWAQVGFGHLHYPLILRVLIIALTLTTVGFQLAAAAFLASVFEIKR